jgi:hypothetical protein
VSSSAALFGPVVPITGLTCLENRLTLMAAEKQPCFENRLTLSAADSPIVFTFFLRVALRPRGEREKRGRSQLSSWELAIKCL